jgi:hypothetical protein
MKEKTSPTKSINAQSSTDTSKAAGVTTQIMFQLFYHAKIKEIIQQLTSVIAQLLYIR